MMRKAKTMSEYTVINHYTLKVMHFVEAESQEQAEEIARDKETNMSDHDILEMGLDYCKTESYKR